MLTVFGLEAKVQLRNVPLTSALALNCEVIRKLTPNSLHLCHDHTESDLHFVVLFSQATSVLFCNTHQFSIDKTLHNINTHESSQGF